MAKSKRIKRTRRNMSSHESAEYDRLIEKLDAEQPQIEAWANAALDRLETIERVVTALRAARVKKGVSLSQVEEASGLGRSNVSRLENHPDPNPKLETLLAYAAAIGVELRIAIVDKATGKAVNTKGEAA